MIRRGNETLSSEARPGDIIRLWIAQAAERGRKRTGGLDAPNPAPGGRRDLTPLGPRRRGERP